MQNKVVLKLPVSNRYFFGVVIPSVLAPFACIVTGTKQFVYSFIAFSKAEIPLLVPNVWYGDSFVTGLVSAVVMLVLGFIIIWAVRPRLLEFFYYKKGD
jgi:hypothetical protein